jgi:hypothetical protein
MLMPPIRYPLPTLVIVILVALAAWKGEVLSRPLRSALASRVRRAFEGPPIPHSEAAQVVAGPIVRRALLLHDDVAASDRPGGRPAETIHLRMFVDIYDVWPLDGEPAAYRVGNRRPIGWVGSGDLLPWNTRLVVRPPAGAHLVGPSDTALPPCDGKTAYPVLSWSSEVVEIACWDPTAPWTRLQARVHCRRTDLPPERWGVWLSRDELLALLRRANAARSSEARQIARLGAIVGQINDDRALSADSLARAREFLPSAVFDDDASDGKAAARLARLNQDWSPEASWSGLTFQSIPLRDLP